MSENKYTENLIEGYKSRLLDEEHVKHLIQALPDTDRKLILQGYLSDMIAALREADADSVHGEALGVTLGWIATAEEMAIRRWSSGTAIVPWQ